MKLIKFIRMSMFLGMMILVAGYGYSQTWSTSESIDEMTGARSCYATSSVVSTTEPMGFPYGDIKAWLGVGYDGKNVWVYVGRGQDIGNTRGSGHR